MVHNILHLLVPEVIHKNYWYTVLWYMLTLLSLLFIYY